MAIEETIDLATKSDVHGNAREADLGAAEYNWPSSKEQGAQEVPAAARPALERYINFSSVVYFSMIILISWETFAVTFQFALLNGGPASMVYGCVLVGFGAMAVALSMAEMASMDPTVGAQYRWSASFAPFAPRFWGLVQGWVTVSAWVINCAGPTAIIATVIQSLLIFNYNSYEPKTWHTMLIMWAFILIPFVLNFWFRNLVNAFELLAGIFHIVFFIVSIITLVILAPRSPTDFVFNTLTRGESGWDNPGVCFGLGLLTITYSVSGFDGVLHMSDEVVKVRRIVPQSIIISTLSNVIMLFGFVICLLYTIGNVEQVMNSPTGLPLIEIFYQATNSKPATNFFVLIPAIILLFGEFNDIASVSRLVWQFSRDNGLPFSKFFSYVHPTLKLPLNALALVCAISFLISILYVISTTAFNAIVSLAAISLASSYVPPILFITIRKLRGSHLRYGPFKLGRFGIPINMLAVAYLLYVITWMPFPSVLPVTTSTFNYAGPLLGAIIIAALIDWTVSGHKRFQVPVARDFDGRARVYVDSE